MADQERYFRPLADLLRLATETVSAKNAEEQFLSGARDARIPARGLLDGNPGRIEPEWWSVMCPDSLLADGVVWFDREKATYLSSPPPFRAERIEVEENAFCKDLDLPLRRPIQGRRAGKSSSFPKTEDQTAKKRGGGLKRGRYYGPLKKHLKWRKDEKGDLDTASLKELREDARRRLTTDGVKGIPTSRSGLEDAIRAALRDLGVNR